MFIQIKSRYGDKLLAGKSLSFDSLRLVAEDIFQKHDETHFVAAFCQKLGYKELPYSQGYAAFLIDLDIHAVFVTPDTFPKVLDGAR